MVDSISTLTTPESPLVPSGSAEWSSALSAVVASALPPAGRPRFVRRGVAILRGVIGAALLGEAERSDRPLVAILSAGGGSDVPFVTAGSETDAGGESGAATGVSEATR